MLASVLFDRADPLGDRRCEEIDDVAERIVPLLVVVTDGRRN